MSSFTARVAGLPTARRLAMAAAAALVVLAALVVVGRWERGRWADGEMEGMRRIEALVGPLDQPALTGYRVDPGYDCLVYGRNGNPYALELCVDPSGRLIEAIDRRRPTRVYYSVRQEPALSTIHVDRAEVDRLLRRMGAPAAGSQ